MPTSPIWRGFMVNADYVWITGDAFTDMRLLIEGAIVLYEEDPIYPFSMYFLSAANLRVLTTSL